MSIHPFLKMEGASRRHSAEDPSQTHTYQCSTQPQTPPCSTSGSPRVKFEGEFDEGVEALIRTHGPVKTWTPLSPLPGHSRNPMALQPMRSITQPLPPRSFQTVDLPNDYPISRRGTIGGHNRYSLAVDHQQQSSQGNYRNPDTSYGYGACSPSLQAPSNTHCYPSPPPDGEGRHINQKYTTEEGDYIIYAWHDKKMKWQRIKQEFAARFGTTPERTIQGLQAWYYRMNQRIPVWDQEGWLCFDNEDDLEPQHVSIKVRERDNQDKPMEPLGIAQRYPERAIHYSWVDAETKFKAQDWGTCQKSFAISRQERET
ncbi:uncharacterized protein FSUBG_13575 [Fusarium subglutinans]|uniref:Uncharacterized protein n=1 Tax=Gibberella subglutinans TaxID=42677 RepID=A0A8H5KX55_GIBSU|nr:uncharacterized protein FSUBG_13575 [Fusarium subglutinans]KAF5579620.1 hypothetical protein FSUBG_13575 [Fusarium subglutinans]